MAPWASHTDSSVPKRYGNLPVAVVRSYLVDVVVLLHRVYTTSPQVTTEGCIIDTSVFKASNMFIRPAFFCYHKPHTT